MKLNSVKEQVWNQVRDRVWGHFKYSVRKEFFERLNK